jgi:3',5'-cyclic-AMP phosphodiesterase
MSANDNPFSTIPIKSRDLQALLAQHQSEALMRFVHVSDTHISADPTYTHDEADYTALQGAQALVRELNALPFTPDFVMHTGDVAFDPHESAYLKSREVLSQIKHPVYYIPGNHDNTEMFQRVFLGAREIRETFDYEFEVNGVQIVCMDSNRPAEYAGGAVSTKQLEWLQAICKSNDPRPLVVMVHHNVLPVGSPFWDTFMRMKNGDDFHRVLCYARQRIRGVFHGHVHQATETYRDGILYSSVPSTWYQLTCFPGQSNIIEDRDAEPGFNVVTITRTSTFIRRHRFRVPEHGQSTPREVREFLATQSAKGTQELKLRTAPNPIDASSASG